MFSPHHDSFPLISIVSCFHHTMTVSHPSVLCHVLITPWQFPICKCRQDLCCSAIFSSHHDKSPPICVGRVCVMFSPPWFFSLLYFVHTVKQRWEISGYLLVWLQSSMQQVWSCFLCASSLSLCEILHWAVMGGSQLTELELSELVWWLWGGQSLTRTELEMGDGPLIMGGMHAALQS